jgi:hypothetical protein
MRVGDLVKFSKGAGWLDEIEGKIGIVVAIRQAPARRDGRWHEWDCLVDGKLQAGFYVRLDEPGYLRRYGVKNLSKVCNP